MSTRISRSVPLAKDTNHSGRFHAEAILGHACCCHVVGDRCCQDVGPVTPVINRRGELERLESPTLFMTILLPLANSVGFGRYFLG